VAHLCERCAGGSRLAIVRLLLAAGASPRQSSEGGATPLHAAARSGPLALVELLIRGGALSWQTDRRGKTALDYARAGTADEREAIVELLDRPVIRDANFRAAVGAIHTGNVDGLSRVLDRHPHLLRARAVEPDCYPQDYFRDPKLFWFIANNPTLMQQMPANIAAVAQAMLARGVEQADLDYTLELVISNNDEIMGGHQAEVLALLLSAGANASMQAIAVALAHWQIAPIRALLDRGLAMTAPIAAALGETGKLANLLSSASADERQMALGLAVISFDDSGVPAVLGEQLPCFVRVRGDDLQRASDQLGKIRVSQSEREGDWAGGHADRPTHVTDLCVVVEGTTQAFRRRLELVSRQDGQQRASEALVGGTEQLAGNEVCVLVEDQGENADADSQGAQPSVAHRPEHVGHEAEDEDRQDSGRSREVRVKDRRRRHDERQRTPGQGNSQTRGRTTAAKSTNQYVRKITREVSPGSGERPRTRRRAAVRDRYFPLP
jgi:hypothetical protein